MNRPWQPSWPPAPPRDSAPPLPISSPLPVPRLKARVRVSLRVTRHGSTLIEVLAGLVVLATLLVAVCIARGRFLRQWADADKRLAAVHSADNLLSQWLAAPNAKVPVPAQAALDDAPGYFWRTSTRQDSSAESLSATIVRLEVYESARPTAGPVFAVDFLRHVYPKLPPPTFTPPPPKGPFQ